VGEISCRRIGFGADGVIDAIRPPSSEWFGQRAKYSCFVIIGIAMEIYPLTVDRGISWSKRGQNFPQRPRKIRFMTYKKALPASSGTPPLILWIEIVGI
jgi:hypothetical protein